MVHGAPASTRRPHVHRLRRQQTPGPQNAVNLPLSLACAPAGHNAQANAIGVGARSASSPDYFAEPLMAGQSETHRPIRPSLTIDSTEASWSSRKIMRARSRMQNLRRAAAMEELLPP